MGTSRPSLLFSSYGDGPIASIEQLTLDRVREYQRVIEALSRIGPQALTPQQLMQHVTAQVSRATMISRTKVLRYRPEKGDLLVEAGVGWKPGVVGNATLAVDYSRPQAGLSKRERAGHHRGYSGD